MKTSCSSVREQSQTKVIRYKKIRIFTYIMMEMKRKRENIWMEKEEKYRNSTPNTMSIYTYVVPYI